MIRVIWSTKKLSYHKVSASKNVSGLVFIYFSNQKFGHTYQKLNLPKKSYRQME